MSIKNYEESGVIIKSEEDEDIKKLMEALLMTLLFDKQLNCFGRPEEVDLALLMEIAKTFFNKKHLLKAALDSTWHELSWWGEEPE